VVFTGGGSGGHVYPGLAVADELRRQIDVRLIWIGSRRGIERRIVEKTGIPYVGTAAGKLRRYFSLQNFVDVLGVGLGILRSLLFMGLKRPALVFAKGGYVSVPPVIGASLWGIPIVTHESDADPGLATRINARFATRILVPYERTIDSFPPALKPRVSVTGNPVRRDIFGGDVRRGLRFCGFADDSRPVLLILGGSLGARDLNTSVAAVLPRILADWKVIHQTGDRSDDIGLPQSSESYSRHEYLEAELPDVLAAADLVLCRAGASTVWECATLAKPMILVPLSQGTRGDQILNAGLFSDANAAIVVESGDPDEIIGAIESVSEKGVRNLLGRNAHNLIHIDSTDQIVTILKELIEAR